MKFVRVDFEGEAQWGVLEDNYVRFIDSDPFRGWNYTGEQLKKAKAKYLAPCEPSKIVCVGKNYYDHAVEMAEGIPEKPVIFIKPDTTVNDPEGNIKHPKISERVDYEGELAIVIGKKAKNLREHNALDYVFGITILNDVTARDIQKNEDQWTRGKCFDGFAPIGPCIATDVDFNDLKIETRLNGETVQSSRTSKMMWNVPKLLEFITQCMTLKPGDVVATGTPAGIGKMEIGDTVEVEIENVGILKNTVTK